MISKFFFSSSFVVLCSMLFGQNNFPYTISLNPVSVEGLDGIHSNSYGQIDGLWVIIGGRNDGIHARQPFNAFPASQSNSTIYLVDPEEGLTWTVSVNSLPNKLREQMQASNMQFYQDGQDLIVIGGYGFSLTEDDHVTYPYLTIIDLLGLKQAILDDSSIDQYFQQLEDEMFAVTGGNLGKIGEEYYLVGGHRFDGRYNPMSHPTFSQTYTDAIRKFTLENNSGVWSFENNTTISDPVHLHRRDYNLLPQLFPDGEFGYTIFSGVFQLNQDLPFLYPVDIKPLGHKAQSGFNQYLSNYHSAHIALHDSETNNMHNLFFGGISQYYYYNNNLVQDDNVPFVKTISRVSRDADGTLEESKLPIEMPGFLGASAELILNKSLPLAAPGIVELSTIPEDSISLGYIFGGIESQYLNPFTNNNTLTTEANTMVYEVTMIREETTHAIDNKLSGYHGFKVTVVPNPVDNSTFRISAETPEAGSLELFLTDSSGGLILNEWIEGLEIGNNTLEVEMESPVHGMTFLTVVLNGKYFASTKIVFNQ